jgi:hypothetical protein
MPHKHANRVFTAPNAGSDFALLLESGDRRLVPREEALHMARVAPSEIRWHSRQRIRVRHLDGAVRELRVPVCQRVSDGDFALKSVPISIPRPTLPRRHHVGGRGKILQGGAPHRTNAMDNLVEAACGSNPILAAEFKSAWAGRLAVPVTEV